MEGRLVRRAWRDPEFRARLLADPRAAYAEEFGAAWPEGLEVRVVEERPDLVYLVVPVDLGAFPDAAVRLLAGQPPAPAD